MFERVQVIDVAEVYALGLALAAAMDHGDLERWLSLWCEDGVQLPPDAPRQVGKKQIWTAVQAWHERFDMSAVSIQTEEVRILGDWAYSHGTFAFERTPKQGGATSSRSGKFLDVLQRQGDGSWKIVVNCFNYDGPSK